MAKMTVNAVAIWNEKEGYWDVSVLSTYDGINFNGIPCSEARASEHTISDCDEYVFPWAILQHNGINTDYINKAIEAYEG